MATRHNASFGAPSSSFEPPTTTSNTISDEQTKIEFYRTYDAMIGIRIAATLGGFFGLMVILVVYKSKSKTERALENPKLAAAAVAEVEAEEERQIHAALEASVYQQLNPRSARRSLDVSASPLVWPHGSTRFSSIGGYSSLIEPPARTHSRLPFFVDEDSPPEDDRTEIDDVLTYNRYLDVPRRPSNITCSSSGSSYLERRGSSVILGLPALPAHKTYGHRRQSSPLPEQQYDFYYPIDIRVIQPTPGGTPCGSERALYDSVPPQHLTPRRAPLASISSCNTSFGIDYPDLDVQSMASIDSVFRDEDYTDTEDEVEPFSTDSETSGRSIQGAWCRRDSTERGRRASRAGYERRPSTSGRRPSTLEKTPSFGEKRHSCSERRYSLSERRPSINEKRKSSISERRKSSISGKISSISEKCSIIIESRTSTEDNLNISGSNPNNTEFRMAVADNKSINNIVESTQGNSGLGEDRDISELKNNPSNSNNSEVKVNIKDVPYPSKTRTSLYENKRRFSDYRLEQTGPTNLSHMNEKRLSVTELPVRAHSLNQPTCHIPSTSQSAASLISSGDLSQTVTLPTLPLIERSSSNLKQEGSWSQETLF